MLQSKEVFKVYAEIQSQLPHLNIIKREYIGFCEIAFCKGLYLRYAIMILAPHFYRNG